MRILFATEPDTEQTVRQRIDLALSAGQQQSDGIITRWRLRASQVEALSAGEADHAERLIHS